RLVPNRTRLTATHLQGANKIGSSPGHSVVSTRQRVWNTRTGREIPNLYIMDSSIFPTSAGGNPMQTIYTFAKIFSDRLIKGIEAATPTAASRHATTEFARSGHSPALRPL